MDIITTLGFVLIAYGAVTLYVALLKPKWVWELGKIEGFVQLLGEKGTVVLFSVVALAAAGAGLWFLLR